MHDASPMRMVHPAPATDDAETTISRLEAQIRIQTALIRSQSAALPATETLFERASEAARIGLWECRLPDERLRWTGSVYDIFGLPRDASLDRREILTCYTKSSLEALTASRSRAIAERNGFALDAEIVTREGRRRWVRLTATVDSEAGVAVRLFGMKQDITDDKVLAERMRYRAEFDGMTGLANRSRFQERLAAPLGALLLVDLDGFKRINDSHGHAIGDECLKEAALRLAQVCDLADLVARIGGDEFAVILDGTADRATASDFAERIVTAMHRPFQHRGQSLRLGASIGIASTADCTPAELFSRADTALYAAKAGGRNTFRWFEPIPIPTLRVRALPAATP